jgi:LacI family transcriptional regulator
MSVTIYDVADLSHVSVTTISKILNHKDFDISAETRERVLGVIKELKFTPSGLARSLVTKKTNVLGLLLPDISNQYFADMARGVEDGANSLGYNVILCNTDENHKKELEYLHILQERCTDGIIVVPIAESESIFTSEFDFEKPFVLLDRVYENMGTDINQVRFDNVKGGYLAVKCLTDRGHKRIGIITGSNRNRPSNDRLKGYKMALEHAGIELDKKLFYEGNFKYESGLEGAKYLIDSGVTAIFATNDIMASGAYKAILAQGLKIPDDISVVGYDNVSLSEILDPPLTTIMQPKNEMGKVAATMLVHMIKKEETEDDVVFQPSIVERQSVRVIK